MYTVKHNFLLCSYMIFGNMFRPKLGYLQDPSEYKSLFNS
jgi:hypothetical protein